MSSEPVQIVEFARPEWETWGRSHDDAFDIARRDFSRNGSLP